MDDLPLTAGDYGPEDLRRVKDGCPEVANHLSRLIDRVVLVGDVYPALLIDLHQEGDVAEDGSDRLDRHVGTRDTDLGFAVGLVEKGSYTEVSTRFARCGFAPDQNELGNLTPQRWRHEGADELKIDLLISPIGEEEEGASIKHLEETLAAIVTPGLELAFEDTTAIELSGHRLRGPRLPTRFRSAGRGLCVSEGLRLPAAWERQE